jgi:molybdate transport system regulatory protein
MKISARNKIKGKIIDIQKSDFMAKIKIELPDGQIISSVITNESATELDLKVGDDAFAIIKSTEVMIGK